MKEYVTDLKQLDDGVQIELGKGAEKAKLEKVAAKCAPGGPGCKSDCCDPQFRAAIEGIDVEGVDSAVTMHLRGALTVEALSERMVKCNCYDED